MSDTPKVTSTPHQAYTEALRDTDTGKMAKSSGKAGYIGGAILLILGLGIIGMTIFRPELLKIKEFKEVGYAFGSCASVAGIGIMLIQRDHNIQDSL